MHTQLIPAAEVRGAADILRPYMATARLGVEIDTGLVGNTVVPWTSQTTTAQWLANERWYEERCA